MEMVSKRLLLIWVLLILVLAFFIFLTRPPFPSVKLESINHDPDLNDPQKWVITRWNAHMDSWGKIEGGRFQLYFKPVRLDEWGNVAITQGNQAHCPIENPVNLKERVIIKREGNNVCFVMFRAKWHQITFLKSEGICQIGITIYLDVGLDFCSPDVTQPHALVVDFIFSKFEDGKVISEGEYHWQTNPYENDYHSAFIVGSMPNREVVYSFELRVDELIRKSLSHWNFDQAEIKGIHAWLDGKNIEGSCEIDYVQVMAMSPNSIWVPLQPPSTFHYTKHKHHNKLHIG